MKPVKSRKKQSTFKTLDTVRSKIRTFKTLIIFLALVLGANFFIQIIRKPIEVLSLLPLRQEKTTFETWNQYKEIFIKNSRSPLTPSFLAALVQKETSGNPLATPEWTWSWTSDLTRVYAPSSSAAGLLQMTDGTFDEAMDLCLEGDQIYRRVGISQTCEQIPYPLRILPSHSVFLTSVYIRYHLERMLEMERVKKLSLEKKQTLSAVIHLCGPQKARLLLRSRFHWESLGMCGSHHPQSYVKEVFRLSLEFHRLSQRE